MLTIDISTYCIIVTTHVLLSANVTICTMFIISAKEVMFLPGFVCLFVRLFVNKITQKLMDGF